jgi:hypothetical protein
VRRLLTVLLLTVLVTSTPLAQAQAQDVTVTDFDPPEGIERAIGRWWMAPMTTVQTSGGAILNEDGTPVAEWRERPVATPTLDTPSGIGMFVVSVLLFDKDENAAAAFDLFDEDQQEDFRRNPRMPAMEDLPLNGIGDQAVGYIGEITQENITITYAFTSVQDGPFLYYVVSESAGIDPVGLMQETAEALVDAPMNRMAEQFDPDGGSRGGLWSKLDGVQPEMPEGSTINDVVIYPEPEATPDASIPNFPRLDLDNPDTIAGLESLERLTYTDGTGATQASDDPGVFRIDAMILTFDSAETARAATMPLGNTLIEPFGIIRGGSGVEGMGEESIRTESYEGFIEDRSLPAGNCTVLIRQEGPVVVAVVVYAIVDDPYPVAEAIIPILHEQGFPQEDDPVLQGLVPSRGPAATPAS